MNKALTIIRTIFTLALLALTVLCAYFFYTESLMQNEEPSLYPIANYSVFNPYAFIAIGLLSGFLTVFLLLGLRVRLFAKG